MATFTLYFCGTDCWPDESLTNRDGHGGSNPAIYGRDSGYIPAKLHAAQVATRDQLKAVIPGPGAAWHANWSRLWVPCTINTAGGASRDSISGESMWDLAGHAAAKVVGVPSRGRGQREPGDVALGPLATQVRNRLGADVNPPDTAKPPSHDCYRFNTDLLELLVAAATAGYGGRGKVTTINAIGHSRGGVAAIMAAHELNYLFPDVPVNIFAIDPVPGSGALSREMMSLASNVKNYVGVYAIDEISIGFNGVVPRPIVNGALRDPLKRVSGGRDPVDIPNYHLIFSPGRHGTVAGNRTSNGKADAGKVDDDIAAVGALVSRLASACLRAWGTDVPITEFAYSGPRHLDAARLLTWHKDQMTAAAPKYRNMRNFTYMPGDSHSWQHWRERGITSSEGSNPSNWEYLEDSIGELPLGDRTTRSWVYSRPARGEVVWQAIQAIDDGVFRVGRWEGDRS